MITKKVHAVTMIDNAMGWPEIAQLDEKKAKYLAKRFDAQWLCRCPRPAKVVCNNGGEFIGGKFQELLHSYSVEQVPTTVANPQSWHQRKNAFDHGEYAPGNEVHC